MPHLITQTDPNMDSVAITVAGTPVGVVVHHEGERGYHFRAAVRTVDALDGHVFASPRAAEQAARLEVFTSNARTFTRAS